jgi:predicted  nucleic acid-binding Zn-ribbon protein
MIRIRRGTALLNKVVKQFDQAVADLEVAAKQIDDKQEKKRAKLRARYEAYRAYEAQVSEENAALEDAFQRAVKVKANITKLIEA